MLEKIEKNFWIFLALALISGLAFGKYGQSLQFLLTPLLGVILLLIFLKTECRQVLEHAKKPLLLIYVLSILLIAVPIVTFVITKPINPELAIGLLLLASTPPAIASPLLTEIAKGNTSLTLATVIPAYMIAPFLMPFLFIILAKESITIDPLPMFMTLATLIFVPLIISQTLKRTPAAFFIEKTKKYYSAISILVITLIIFIAVSVQAEFIIQNPIEALSNLAWVYGFFILMHILGYLAVFWRKKEDRIAVSIVNTYMNSALAIVLAVQFFTPEVVLITVLAQAPWNTLLQPFKWIVKS